MNDEATTLENSSSVLINTLGEHCCRESRFKMFKFGIYLCLLASIVGVSVSESCFEIHKNGSAVCMGTVVKKVDKPKSIFVLTAARCVYKVPESSLTISSTEALTVKRVRVHPAYSPTNVDYDVALIQLNLKQTQTNSNIIEVDISPTKPSPNDHLKIGLQDVQLVDLKTCQKNLGNSIRLASDMICASSVPANALQGSALIKTGQNKTEVLGVAFFGSTTRVFTAMFNTEIYSFVNKVINPFGYR